MKSNFKKVISILLSLAIVVTGINISPSNVQAALAGTELESKVNNATYNLALNKNTEVYPGIAEGQQSFLNDGIVDNTNNNHAALSSGWGYLGEAYAIIDLGNYYRVVTYIPFEFNFFKLNFYISISGETKII